MARPTGDDGAYRPFMAVHYRVEGGNIPAGLECRNKLFAISPTAYGKAPKTGDVRDVTCADCKAWLKGELRIAEGYVIVKTYEDGEPIRVDGVLYPTREEAQHSANIEKQQNLSLGVDHWNYEVWSAERAP